MVVRALVKGMRCLMAVFDMRLCLLLLFCLPFLRVFGVMYAVLLLGGGYEYDGLMVCMEMKI
jgi:hypothetical protein